MPRDPSTALPRSSGAHVDGVPWKPTREGDRP